MIRSQNDYTKLITRYHRHRDKFVATVGISVAQLSDAQLFINALPEAFDIDTAIGKQLDIDGEWIGRSRIIPTPTRVDYFCFDDPDRGFDGPPWFNPGDPDYVLSDNSLNDTNYRRLLFSKIAANNWDGTIEAGEDAYMTYFETLGGKIWFAETPPAITANDVRDARIGWYRMDGDIKDYSGFRRDATADVVHYTIGNVGPRALDLKAIANVITDRKGGTLGSYPLGYQSLGGTTPVYGDNAPSIGQNFDFDLTDTFSIAVWVKFWDWPNKDAEYVIFSKLDDFKCGYSLSITSDKKLRVRFADQVGVKQFAELGLSDDVLDDWTHFLVTYSGSGSVAGV